MIREAYDRLRGMLEKGQRSNRQVEVEFFPFTTLTLKDFTTRFELRDADNTVLTTSLRDLEKA